MDKHTIAARRIADALTTIHAEFSVLPFEDREALVNIFAGLAPLGSNFDGAIGAAATMLEARHPFEPVSESEKQTLFEQVYEDMCDSHPKDQTWAYMGDMEDWQMRAEIDDRREYLASMEDGE